MLTNLLTTNSAQTTLFNGLISLKFSDMQRIIKDEELNET